MTELSYTVIDSAPGSLHKTSVLVAEVLDSGRRLTRVLLTAGDPDFYFGAEVIADAFPQATFVAPADVIEHIQHSYEGKLQAWSHLGPNLPTRLVDVATLT